MRHIQQKLQDLVTGEVLTQERELRRYCRDQSMYEVAPLAVVVPAAVEDVIATVRFAAEAGVSVTARGGGSGTAGAALGSGIVLAFPRQGPMSGLVGFEYGPEQGLVAVCEPGLLHDELQRALGERGLFLPADPSSGSMSVIGGNVATKASGPHALKHGSIDRYLQHIQAVLPDGTVMDTGVPDSIPARIAEGVEDLRRTMLASPGAASRLRARDGSKIASGYNLFPLVRSEWCGVPAAVGQLLVGSVGTLAITTGVSLRSEARPRGRTACLVFFADLGEAGEAVRAIRDVGVAAIEIMNARTVRIVRERRPGASFPGGNHHMLLIECTGEARREQVLQVERIVNDVRYRLPMAPVVMEDAADIDRLWALRKALLPTIRGFHPTMKPLSVVNDVGVPVDLLATFIERVQETFDALGLHAAIYGHAGSGNLHLRPLFDITDPGLDAKIRDTADRIYELVCAFGGTITAEHGMGPLRAPYLEAEWGPEIVGFMRRVKQLFDPEGVLNPGAMFPLRSITDRRSPLRVPRR